MKKRLLAAASIALIATAARAQVPYTFANQSGSVPASELDSNFNYVLSVLQAKHATNNAALQAISTVSTSAVIRDGFVVAGDAPQVAYFASNSACSLNAGAGDNGFQVKSADGNCWLIAPQQTYDVREWGMTTTDGSGTTNGPALTNIAADTGSHTFFFPVGSFLIPCTTTYAMASSISLLGATGSALALPNSCTITAQTPLMTWINQNNVTVRGMTINLNGPTYSALPHSVLSFNATNGNTLSGLNVEYNTINAGSETITHLGGLNEIIVAASNSGGQSTYDGVNVSRNYLTATATHEEIQCIVATTSSGTGKVNSAKLDFNTCIGAGIEFDGANTDVSGNDVSNYAFGAGINGTQSTGATPASNYGCSIKGNVIHDTNTGVDVNNTTAEGLENDCVNSLIENNLFYNLGGDAIQNYANQANIIGNLAVDVGKSTTAQGIAFANVNSGNADGLYSSSNVTYIGNVAYDDGAGVLLIGFYGGSNTVGTVLRGNKFSGVTQGISLNGGITVSSDAGYIQTQTASAGTSIAFTGLDTASYHRWRLSCHDVFPSSAAIISLQVGEGSTTWNTGANYGYNVMDGVSGTFGNGASSTGTSIPLSITPWNNASNAPGNFVATFGDLSATASKFISFSGVYQKSTGGSIGPYQGVGYWNGDTGAITAIRVIAPTFNISGSCTLEGYPQ